MGFERCHPGVNLMFFTAVITSAAVFRHPVFLVISALCACAYSIRRYKGKAAALILCLLPLTLAFALYYSSYHHFGITVLRQNFVGNNMTLESLVYGLVLGGAAAVVCLWMACVFSVLSTDKIVFFFGSVSPGLSMFFSIVLRMIPRIQREARKIHMAQQGIGRGVRQGNLFQRLRNGLRIVSMVITWILESIMTTASAMKSRGSKLRGRTAFSIYRFDNRDRLFVVFLSVCLTMTLMAGILGMTDMVYDPVIQWKPVPPMAVVLYLGYGTACLMPLGLEVWTDYRFRKARGKL